MMANRQPLAFTIFLHAPEFSAGLQLYALLSEQCAKLPGEFAVFFIKQLRAVFQHRYLDSKTREHLGELYTNRAAANNCQAAREIGKRNRLHVSDEPGLAQSLYWRHHSLTTGRNNNAFSFDGLTSNQEFVRRHKTGLAL